MKAYILLYAFLFGVKVLSDLSLSNFFKLQILQPNLVFNFVLFSISRLILQSLLLSF